MPVVAARRITSPQVTDDTSDRALKVRLGPCGGKTKSAPIRGSGAALGSGCRRVDGGSQRAGSPGRLRLRGARRAPPRRSCPGSPGMRTTPQSRQSRCTMNMPCPPGRPGAVRGARGGLAGAAVGDLEPQHLAVQAMRSSSGPSACRQALVTSSETTSRTSSAAARRSAVDGGQPAPVVQRLAGEVAGARHDAADLAAAAAVRHCRSDRLAGGLTPAPVARRPPAPGRRSPGGYGRVVLISASPHRFTMSHDSDTDTVSTYDAGSSGLGTSGPDTDTTACPARHALAGISPARPNRDEHPLRLTRIA